MKKLAYLLMGLFVSPLAAAPFQNLDFEQATLIPASSPTVPFDAYNAYMSVYALPSWTITEDATTCNAVWGGTALDETSVEINNSSPIQGSYSVYLSSIDFGISRPPYYQTSSISQTGLIPSSTKSIHFLVEGSPSNRIFAMPMLTMNGIDIPLITESVLGNISLMAGDISSFAGTTSNLEFTAESQGTYTEDNFGLDSISFSTVPVPEPTFIVGILSLLMFRRKQR